MNQMFIELMQKENVISSKNVVLGQLLTNKYWYNIIPSWLYYVPWANMEYYFLYFDERGIEIYPCKGRRFNEESYFVKWDEIENFYIEEKKEGLFILLKIKEHTYTFLISRKIGKCYWIEDSIEHLNAHSFYYQ